ncbi:hypothetical protein [Dyella sp. C11]|uniref:hypothetical protein n=1 Tax=Dyella sp. C11 TaxID=2126991 RepID=UPI000D64B350|nr:hypothetical protein [Dyella sp. C11]
MKTPLIWLFAALRIAFGALFVFAGLNDLLHFWQPPAPTTSQSQLFLDGLVASGCIFPVLGVVFTISGLFLLANRFVALGLVMLAAPVVVIFSYHAVMEHHLAGPGLALLIVHLILSWQQRATFAVLLRPTPAPAVDKLIVANA